MTLALEGHSSSKMWALVDVHMGFNKSVRHNGSSILKLKCCCLCHETDVRVARSLTDLHCIIQHEPVVYYVVSTLLVGGNLYDWHLGHLQKQYVLSDRHKLHAFWWSEAYYWTCPSMLAFGTTFLAQELIKVTGPLETAWPVSVAGVIQTGSRVSSMKRAKPAQPQPHSNDQPIMEDWSTAVEHTVGQLTGTSCIHLYRRQIQIAKLLHTQ